MADTIIPPWMRPVSPLGLQLIDDQTAVFTPRFGRNRMQRAKFSDPRWGATLRFQGMRDYERAALRRVLLDAQGRSGSIWWGPGVPQRGSFPAPELLTNNDFNNGTTGWAGATTEVLTVSDRALRLTFGSSADSPQARQLGTACAQYAPYACRAVTRSPFNHAIGVFLQSDSAFGSTALIANGLTSALLVSLTTSLNTIAIYRPGALNMPGEYFDIAWSSVARCALVDGGANALLHSSNGTTSPWGVVDASITANWAVAPDGTTTATLLTAAAPAGGYSGQSFTVPSAAADYTVTVALKAESRGWAFLQISDFSVSGTGVFINLSSGALGTVIGGGSWANERRSVVSLGNAWWQVSITARKTGSATTCGVAIHAADSDNVFASSGSIMYWRATLSQNSVAGRLVGTGASALPTGTAQTSSTIPLKGLPASTNGLLLAGDFVQVGSQLVQLTAPLNSNAAGQGTMTVAPAVLSAPDNTPVIINNPMGRFMLANDPQITERYGLYTDAELELVEVFS